MLISVKFCVIGNLEKKMKTSLHWDNYPVNQTLQNSADVAVPDMRCGRRGGQGRKGGFVSSFAHRAICSLVQNTFLGPVMSMLLGSLVVQ